MNVSFEKPTNASGLLTISLEKADYQPAVEKELKNYRKNAQVPGFRPGNAPMSIIQKRVGPAIKAEQVQRLVNDELYKYLNENKVPMLGHPLSSDKQKPQDIDAQDDFEFVFDIALAPEFELKLSADDKIPYYDIKIGDEKVEEQVQAFARRASRPEKAETYTDGDILRGALVEMEGDKPKEGGIDIESASLMPKYMSNEEQKKLFDGAKVGDVIVINPSVAYDNNSAELSSLLKIEKEDVDNHKGDFSYQISEISHMVPAEINQELFDSIYGKDAVKDEKEFRERIKKEMGEQMAADCDYRFLLDVRKYASDKVGQLEFDNDLLRRIIKDSSKEEKEITDEELAKSVDALKWQLMRDRLLVDCGVKLENEELKQTAMQAARFQFAQYGMSGIPDEYIENYAETMLKDDNQRTALIDRALETKLSTALKNVVTLKRKKVTIEEFNDLFKND